MAQPEDTVRVESFLPDVIAKYPVPTESRTIIFNKEKKLRNLNPLNSLLGYAQKGKSFLQRVSAISGFAWLPVRFDDPKNSVNESKIASIKTQQAGLDAWPLFMDNALSIYLTSGTKSD